MSQPLIVSHPCKPSEDTLPYESAPHCQSSCKPSEDPLPYEPDPNVSHPANPVKVTHFQFFPFYLLLFYISSPYKLVQGYTRVSGRLSNRRILDFKGGMMVTDVTNFHNRHWGVGVLECVCVQGFIQDFEFCEGGGGSWGKLMQIYIYIF